MDLQKMMDLPGALAAFTYSTRAICNRMCCAKAPN